jgi:FMN phosphatase YigB (HAD superfamily)
MQGLNQRTPMTPPDAVVFDLGGVMAEICHTWQDAARSAQVHCSKLSGEATALTSFPAFDLYQSGDISIDEYLAELSENVGCKPDDALKLHNGILVTEYPGILELVKELQNQGIRTGCLSNTNPPHWEVLALNGQYPAIHSLEMKMASHLAGLNKPDPAIYRKYCSQFGVEPSSIAFFDDNRPNVDGAASCGWNSRWIDSSKDTPTQLRTYLRELGVT